VEVTPIGRIRSPWLTKESCPIQPHFADGALGTVEFFPPFDQGLDSIDTFSHVYLLYAFDRASPVRLQTDTFLDDTVRGIFACRHPCRPNGIGLSVVRLLRREGNILHVSGIDVLDNTPLLDLKPYIPNYDRADDATPGWTAGVTWRPKREGSE
jgi:tRNA-Thr(GGU) m(6)t(6)A37 methyltransferase TsaA